MKGEALNFRRSNDRGEKAAALDRAKSSWSAADRERDCSS